MRPVLVISLLILGRLHRREPVVLRHHPEAAECTRSDAGTPCTNDEQCSGSTPACDTGAMVCVMCTPDERDGVHWSHAHMRCRRDVSRVHDRLGLRVGRVPAGRLVRRRHECRLRRRRRDGEYDVNQGCSMLDGREARSRQLGPSSRIHGTIDESVDDLGRNRHDLRRSRREAHAFPALAEPLLQIMGAPNVSDPRPRDHELGVWIPQDSWSRRVQVPTFR